MGTVAWVVGGHGLLGSAIVHGLSRRQDTNVLLTHIRWSDTERSVNDLLAGAWDWLNRSEASRFDLYWAAGAGITSTSKELLAQEVEVFDRFLQGITGLLADEAKDVGVFLASSAGGVYAGSARPPFTEETIPAPISEYGVAKLAMEQQLAHFADEAGARVYIARIANLYGPGQRIDKPQGFISHLCRSFLTKSPIAVYVSLDTMRDYIYVDDAAEIVVRGMDLLHAHEGESRVVLKNICSGAPATLGNVLRQAKLVFKRTPAILIAPSVLSAGQVVDLRITSTVWTELEQLPRRSLLIGLVQTRASMELQMSSMRLPSA
jgi:UDP-glucose 4-epimerase